MSLPIGYLIPSLLLAWCTYYVVAPRNWPRMFNSLGFYFGVINELPFLALFWLTGDTWLAFSQGDVSSLVGWLAFGLTILAVAGLLVIVHWGLQTTPVVNRALDDSLGQGWRDAIDAKIARRLHNRLTFTALLGLFFVRRHDVKRIANIQYGDAGVHHLLDVYRHKSLPTNRPVLIHYHGGAMVSGSKNRQALPLLYRLASQGWVCVSANYRLSPAATFPDQLIDAKKVIAWMREYGKQYGADPDIIFVAGSSSGAQLAALAALTSNDPKLQPGFENVDTSVTAAITLYGDYDWFDSIGTWADSGRDRTGFLSSIMKSSPAEDREAWEQASPLTRIRKDAPPFFVIHGDRDTALPVQDARHFAQKLRSISQSPVVYAELPGAEHNLDLFHSIRNEAVMDGIDAFAAWVCTNNKHNSDGA